MEEPERNAQKPFQDVIVLFYSVVLWDKTEFNHISFHRERKPQYISPQIRKTAFKYASCLQSWHFLLGYPVQFLQFQVLRLLLLLNSSTNFMRNFCSLLQTCKQFTAISLQALSATFMTHTSSHFPAAKPFPVAETLSCVLLIRISLLWPSFPS